MNPSPFFELPPFALNALASSGCSDCLRSFTTADVVGAGVRLDPNLGERCFALNVRCSICGEEAALNLPSFRITSHDWPRQFAEMCGYVFHMDRSPSWRWHNMLTRREPRMNLQLHMKQSNSSPYLVFGGYRRAGEDGNSPTYLLIRQPAGVFAVRDLVLRLETRNRIRVAELPAEDKLQPHEWDGFLNIADGSLFTRQGVQWRKLRRFDIEPLLRDRKFTHASLLKRLSRRR